MHITGAIGVPVVAIFGPTHPDLGFWPGYNPGRLIHSYLKCSPCSIHGSKKCVMKKRYCMEKIEWDEVMKNIDEISL